MHHLIFEIKFQTRFISLTSLVAIHLLIQLLSRLCHLCATVLCSIIMVHKGTSSWYRLVDYIGL